VNTRLQLTPALTIALLGSAGWFAVWLFAFRPAPLPPVVRPAQPEFIRLFADQKTLNKLQTPTLFALPSVEGFSGQFIEPRVDLPITLEKPADPVRNLTRKQSASPDILQTRLTEKLVIPQNALPVPGVAARTATPPATAPQWFPSPELQPRAGKLPPLTIDTTGLPATLRVNLTIRPDGTVEQAFFDTPVTNTALLAAIHRITFKSAKARADGWLDIRFPQKESN
jgi:hypothetical protein